MPNNVSQVPSIDGERYSYQLADRLGSGGMGDVFAGLDLKTGQRVAIKVLREVPTADAAIRFSREARAAGRVGSKHVVEVRDFGLTADGHALIVMELLEGETLERRLARLRVLPEPRAIAIVRQLLEILDQVHANGIVHRDLKPANLFLTRIPASLQGGRAPHESIEFLKIIDFGASVFHAAQSDRTSAGGIGTPCYMSPERLFGDDADGRSDLYAVGVILYEAIAGRLPFLADSLSVLAAQVAAGRAPRASNGPVSLVIEQAMAPKPSARFQSAREFIAALDACELGAGPSQLTVTSRLEDLGKLSFSSPARAGAVPPSTTAPAVLAPGVGIGGFGRYWPIGVAVTALALLALFTLRHFQPAPSVFVRVGASVAESAPATAPAPVAPQPSLRAIPIVRSNPPQNEPLAQALPVALERAPIARRPRGATNASTGPEPAVSAELPVPPSSSPAPAAPYQSSGEILDPWSKTKE